VALGALPRIAASQVWRWLSMKPGITMKPSASITSASASAPMPGWTATMRSSSISTSAAGMLPTAGSTLTT
jgi:hypothetical protein